MIELKGNQGKTMVVEGSNVKIIKKGTWFSSKREKTFAIRDITHVEVQEHRRTCVGFIQILAKGARPPSNSIMISGTSFNLSSVSVAVRDENAVILKNEKSYETALKIKEYIESYSV